MAGGKFLNNAEGKVEVTSFRSWQNLMVTEVALMSHFDLLSDQLVVMDWEPAKTMTQILWWGVDEMQCKIRTYCILFSISTTFFWIISGVGCGFLGL